MNLDNFKFTKKNKYVLVFGNEGQGVRKEIIDVADSKIFIEINNIDSLNVGVASSILLYKLSLDLKK
jgi:TrmH family RNA methyltransferase